MKNDITAYHDSGNWDRELARADGAGQRYLAWKLAHGAQKPAITLDIDDTALETYSYEVTHDYGYDVILNVGDQVSDLQGGHADRAVKLPNPMYSIP